MDDEKRLADILDKLEHLAPPQREYVAMLIRLAFNLGQQEGIRWSRNDISRRAH